MLQYQKVKNEWGEQDKDYDWIASKDVEKPVSTTPNYSKHMEKNEWNDPEPNVTPLGAFILIAILFLIGFASCYGLFWIGFLHAP